MDTAIQNILVDLKIISMVEPKGRLYLYNGVLAVESTSFWVPIKRYVYNSNRHAVCQRIKQRILELETLFHQKHIADSWIRDEISKLIEPVKYGISNLKETYSKDSQLCANLDLINSRLNNVSQTFLK